jgi:glycerol kinase
MPDTFILGIDQSTQGTKGLLFNKKGSLVARCDLLHKQIINEKGWIEHDPVEIYQNVLAVVKAVVEKAGIDKTSLAAIGISNQRETVMAWQKSNGKPIYNAIVWQCARAEKICQRILLEGYGEKIKAVTGLPLSPYFSAAKISWLLENIVGARQRAEADELCFGTMDSWLVYCLTGGAAFKTDYSNASRTQLFNIKDLNWDLDLCRIFGIPRRALPEVCDSNALYGTTTFDGWLAEPIPIHAVLGDSQAALFAQNCNSPGMVKATYGTGSSVMMNLGEHIFSSKSGLVTSIAWRFNGKISYALEGNINYTGAVITWLKDDLKLLASAEESQEMAENSNNDDQSYFVPAFSGLGAPYWNSEATGLFTGITRVTGKAEMVRAALDSIAYQITDIVQLMQKESTIEIKELCVDGGPTKNTYLMQFQADILKIPVQVSTTLELSGMGSAIAAGIAMKIYTQPDIFRERKRLKYDRKMQVSRSESLYDGWKRAVNRTLFRA